MLELTQRLLEAARGGRPVVVASVLEPGPTPLEPGSRLLVEQDGSLAGTLGSPELDTLVAGYARDAFARHAAETVYVTEGGLSTRTIPGATSVYLEVVESKPVFLVVGAGHIGRSLAKLADFLDFHVAIIDDREDFADPVRIPEADQVICDDYEAAIDRFPINANTSIVMVTRGHKQDELALRRCLGRGAGYIGMIGSKRRTSTVLQHLRDEGFDPGELDRVRTPIGLDIAAETPEEIAVSIVAEVILMRRGGNGAPMYWRRGRRSGTAE
ncbi:MAG TPA: XdhC/CoxI family protein [Tepidiformaceae bacterium]|nr:XdhC/CoxI family protein [Tepidiformaceae bacterium]